MENSEHTNFNLDLYNLILSLYLRYECLEFSLTGATKNIKICDNTYRINALSY